MTAFALPGRTALVTGAARGIGLETARLLHARGASVTLTDLDSDEVGAAAAGIGERTLALAGDATDRDSLDDAVAATVERFGALDVVVANAGVAPPLRTIASMDPDAFERVVEIDLLGVYRTVHAALPQVATRGGQVVIVSSVYAFANGALASPYAVSKAAVEQLGRALRVELAPHGAGVTVVYPGFADTKMVRDAFTDPVATGLEDLAPPKFVMRRISPALVAERSSTGSSAGPRGWWCHAGTRSTRPCAGSSTRSWRRAWSATGGCASSSSAPSGSRPRPSGRARRSSASFELFLKEVPDEAPRNAALSLNKRGAWLNEVGERVGR